jgi:tryptophan-specific transport protein
MSASHPISRGIYLIVGGAVGAGMFSIPVAASGMWYGWAILLLAATGVMMGLSALFILETNLRFTPGVSFNTLVKETLGPRWNFINGFSLAFVMYILTYAYVSGSSSVVQYALGSIDIHLPSTLTTLILPTLLAAVVWWGTGATSRWTAIALVAMLITSMVSIGGLLPTVQLSLLLDSNNDATAFDYFPYVLGTLTFFLASFGYHGLVPSLVKYYGIRPRLLFRCIVIGTATVLLVYLILITAVFGNLPRDAFPAIAAAGGNIGDLAQALGNTSTNTSLTTSFTLFANFALISSFLAVTLGLFDYNADLFGFDDSRTGRLRTALVTYLPPIFAGMLFPNGFLYAIGFAGVTGTIWGALVPALMVRESRRQHGEDGLRTGSNILVYVLMAYALAVTASFFAAQMGLTRSLG